MLLVLLHTILLAGLPVHDAPHYPSRVTNDVANQTPGTADVKQSEPVLEIRDLAVTFDNPSGGSRRERVRAVDGATLTVHPRQTLALVGESGCGKSVTAMSVLRLNPSPPARYERGRILLRTGGRTTDVLRLPESELRRVRGAQAAMIFQEPMTSLNPVYTIGDQIMEAVLLHQNVGEREARDIAERALLDVGIENPAQRLRAYPHQFSGGMRQRVMIAMALACRPALLLADEPTTALDVTIQAQILGLLRDLQRSRGMSILLITHALGVVAENADVVCVMYGGRVVEYANVYELFDNPMHPYTRGLLRSIPGVRERKARLTTIKQVIDDPEQFEPLTGANFSARPWWPTHHGQSVPVSASYDLCEASNGHWVAVWRTSPASPPPSRPPDLSFRRSP